MDGNPYVSTTGDNDEISSQGLAYLSRLVTDPTGQVYAFKAGSDPVTAAAAMARLSRSPDDLRMIILKEFAGTDEAQAAALLKRVITAYGDDSVQQLVGVHVVVEGASNWLTKALEWGRFGSYLEQSTRYIYFDQTDAKGNYRFYTPDGLGPAIAETYHATMTRIFTRYSAMVRTLTAFVRYNNPLVSGDDEGAWKAATRAQACDAVRTVLPVATRSTVGIFGSAQALDNLVMHLLSLEMEEARRVGVAIYEQVRQVIPAFMERTMKPERGLATVAYKAATRANLVQFVRHNVGLAVMPSTSDVTLVDYWPRDENDLLPEFMFASSGQPLAELRRTAALLPDALRTELWDTMLNGRLNRRHRPGRALEKAHYEFEVTGDYGTFRDLQRHRVIDALEWQRLTPALGYDVPSLVQEAGQSADFAACFADSVALYRLMHDSGLVDEAQYAVLMGHRMRYRFVLNARAAYHFLELRTSPQGHPGYRRIGRLMHEAIAAVHPQIAAGMAFVNRSDMDGELTRLAAERATAYRLRQLGNMP